MFISEIVNMLKTKSWICKIGWDLDIMKLTLLIENDFATQLQHGLTNQLVTVKRDSLGFETYHIHLLWII